MPHPPIQVVDKHDNPAGSASMDEVQKQGLYHRIVRVMLEDREGNVLLQKRAEGLFMYPGCWDNSAAGHVDAGEEYEQAALRETKEEIGVEPILKLVEIHQTSHARGGREFNRFNGVFKGVIPADTEFKLDANEVAEVRWFTQEEMKRLIREQPHKVSDGLEEVANRYYV